MTVTGSTLKTIVMVAALGGVLAGGTACFGLFSDSKKETSTSDPCAGLSGQARTDCEARPSR
jgi:uncharacterized membrane protein